MDVPLQGNYPWLVPLLIGSCAGAVGFAAYVVAEMTGLVKRELSLREQVILPEMTSSVMRSFLPAARAFGRMVRVGLGGARRDDALVNRLLATLQRRLGGSGRPQGINAEEYVGFWVLCIFFGMVLAATAFFWVGAESAYLSLPEYLGLGGGLGLLWWWSWLTKKRNFYRSSIQRELPFCLDLLTLSIEAGLDFTAALSRMVRKMNSTPLGREFSFMLREIQLGKIRADALRDFSKRVDVVEVGTVVASLVQAEELGAGLGPVLRILATQQRERRSQRAEEQAMKAPVKILAPLVACLMPAIMIMIAGPIVIALKNTMF